MGVVTGCKSRSSIRVIKVGLVYKWVVKVGLVYKRVVNVGLIYKRVVKVIL